MELLAIIAALAAQSTDTGAPVAAAPLPRMAIYGAGGAAGGGILYLQVRAGDLDGDGRPDDAVLKLACAGGELRSAHYNVKSPRDSASGQASGKRTHHPVTFVKEWGPATPMLAQIRPGYNIKENKGARMTTDGGGWTAVELSDAGGLCAAAQAAVVIKTRSNIQNN